MRNGIKKLFLTSLFMIFGLCFNSSFAYTEIENCYDTNKLCRDYGVNESYNTNGATISYGAYLNTPWYSKTFMVQYDYTNSSSITFKIRQYLFYNENWYYTIIQAFQRETSPQKTSIYVYSWSSWYCIPEENNNRCWMASNSFKPYNKSIELVNSWINGSMMTWYRIMFRDSTPNLVHVICPMFENWFMFCMPFRQQTNNGVISNNANYWLPTRTNPYSDYTPPFDDRDYISSNYTIWNTPFTTTEPQETTTETTTIIWQCPTINQILSTYSSNYNTWICYSATRLLTQTWIVNTTAQSIFELYPTFTWWLDDYNYYRQYCENVPTSVCREAFSWNEIKWSLLNKTPENNPIGVYQYCHLQLNIEDKNTTTCVMSTWQYYATWVDEAIEEEIQGNQSVLDIMLNSFNNLKDELPSFSSWTVFDEFLEEWETRKDGFKLDIFKTFLELWSKITSIFIFRNKYDGIIPTYITSIIMIILLFKILKK